MAWFRAFRGDFGFSHYGDNRTSVTADIPFAAIIYTCIIVSLAAIIAAAGIRGRERWYTLARVTYSLAVGSVILVSIFAYCWQIGEVSVRSPYIYRSAEHLDGRLGVRFGLRTVNITLTGKFITDGNNVKYNEELLLENVITHPDELWDALDRGLPQPILSITEYVTTDRGGLRFGRNMWHAGYLTHILLWTAFAFWVTGNILITSVIWYGAACFTLTGAVMVSAVITYDQLAPHDHVRLPCSDGPLVLRYGWCFWATLVFGILTLVVGLVLFTLEKKVPKKLAEFFLLDNIMEEDEYHQVQPSLGAGLHSRPGTPDLSFTGLSDCRKVHGAPSNWYMNYGYDNIPRTRSNPAFSEPSILDKHEQVNNSPPRMRTFSHISEEGGKSESTRSLSPDFASGEKDGGEIQFERLSEIYVDVTPSKHLKVPPRQHQCSTVDIVEERL